MIDLVIWSAILVGAIGAVCELRGGKGAARQLWLVAAGHMFVVVLLSAYESNHELAGIASAVCVICLFNWWANGGDDDWRKKRRTLSAAFKRKLRAMRPVFQPVPIRGHV